MIKIYTDVSSPDSELSSSNFNNPLSLTFNGLSGGTQTKKLYLGSTSSNTILYSNIVVEIETTPGNGGIDGIEWKLSKEESPNWLTMGNSITFSNINFTPTTFLTFWINVTIPPNTPIKTDRTTRFKITETTQ